MLNFAKTAFLLSALTALMVLFGGLMGGGATGDLAGAMSGMVCMLAVATVLNFGTWFLADTLVIKSTRAVPVEPHELPWLHEDLANLSEKAGIPTPRLYLVPHQRSPNAFATGRSPSKGVVAVTAGLLETLDRREVNGVIAHELGHIKHRDTLVSAIAATLAGVITFLAYSARYMGRRGRGGGSILALLLALVAPFAALVLRMMISRTREYGADRRAAQLTGDPEALARALEKLGGVIPRVPMSGDAARNVHHFANGFGGGFGRLFSTHPPIEERVARLREMALPS